MYFYLALSVFCATFLFVTFKLFSKYGIDNFQGLVFNYWTAALIAFASGFQINLSHLDELPALLPATLLIGLMFISVFYVTALTTQTAGLAVATVVAKMSVVIPVTAGMILYNERLAMMKIAGIVVALAAVYFTSDKPSAENNKPGKKTFLLPVILFFGTGLVDTSIKFAQHTFMNDENRNIVITGLFGSAGLIGLLKMASDYFKNKPGVKLKNIIGGMVLGTFNYYSLYFLIECFESPGSQSAVVFPLLNTGIVLFSAIIALLFFREKLSSENLAGVALSIAAIFLLTN